MKTLKLIWSKGIIVFAALLIIFAGYLILQELNIEISGKQFEYSLYSFMFAVMLSYLIILSGMENGSFYHKNDNPLPPYLEKYIKNIHFLETDTWRAIGLSSSLFIFASERIANYTTNIREIAIQVGLALSFMIGIILSASYYFQKGVTAGLKDDDHLDAITKSEVAIYLPWIRFKKGMSLFYIAKIQFWKPRIFSNRKRKIAQWFGIAMIIISIIIINIYNKI